MNPTTAPDPSLPVAPPAHPASSAPTDPPSGSAVTITLEPSPPAAAADVVRTVGGRIAPLWPLDRFVAVNPYFGLADRSFEEAAELLATVAGARSTLPPAFYLAAIDRGRVSLDDVRWALAQQPGPAPALETFLAECRSDVEEDQAWHQQVPTVARVASAATARDWHHLMVDRVSAWAAAYTDAGQALWRSSDGDAPLFGAWREEAALDRTPEVMGLRGFRSFVSSLPEDPDLAIEVLVGELAIDPDDLDLYLHALLLQVGGWAAHVSRGVFEQHLAGCDDDALAQFTAVLLAWEVGLLRSLEPKGVRQAWEAAVRDLSTWRAEVDVRPTVTRRLVLQAAFDRAEQQRIVGVLSATGARSAGTRDRPQAQAVFCIDVRSEVFRRHLEAAAPNVDTLGFAGFFGFPVAHVPLAHDGAEHLLPVLLSPAYTVAETVGDPGRDEEAMAARRLDGQVKRAWKAFKMGAVSCFSFVGPVGLAYLPKLFTDGFGWTRPVGDPQTKGLPDWAAATRGPTLAPLGPAEGISASARVDLAEGALRGMSLTDGFAPLVVICGHGATTTNNPYDSGLACGACGGHSGEVSARVAATVFNDPDVRAGLVGRGITIPDDTWFVAAQHDTTTDVVTVFDADRIPESHRAQVQDLVGAFASAGAGARLERSARFGLSAGGSVDQQVLGRSHDWAQVRPEWGLAGCRAFIAAPRARTASVDLAGWSFLHSYDWRQDDGFEVLELIMTAPVVVASWISLQYYASTVDNERFGSGNKVLHNVVGRLGVFEGTAGDLRTGLPWQSVHDGMDFQHEPVRLNVVIEAPTAAMDEVLAKHDHVRHLVENGWVHLLAMGEDGQVTHRHRRGPGWEVVERS